MDCIFCKIINGEIPSKKIYEDELVMAFMDINPICDGHVLVIPKKHYEDIKAVDSITFNRMREVAISLGEKLMKITNEKGYSLSINYGDKQEVKHLHLHIMPNYNKKPEKTIDEIYLKIME